MNQTFAKQLEAAKAYVSLFGSLLTAFIAAGAVAADSKFGIALGVVSALVTAFLTYQVPNAQPTPEGAYVDGHGVDPAA